MLIYYGNYHKKTLAGMANALFHDQHVVLNLFIMNMFKSEKENYNTGPLKSRGTVTLQVAVIISPFAGKIRHFTDL